MPRPIAPLTRLAPDAGQRPAKTPASARKALRRPLIPMALMTLVAIGLGSVPLMIAGAVVWIFWVVRYVLLTQVLDPSGNSTPYVNQHSNIAAMVARGAYAEAADAYRTAIAADPGDVVACEHLAQLALGELKDYDLALFALREAERRVPEPSRQLGYALQIAGMCRERLGDPVRTMVELRRILTRYPDAPNAASLRAELEELRSERFRGQ
jgi:tetratricopeptide (TPR) repeat protein